MLLFAITALLISILSLYLAVKFIIWLFSLPLYLILIIILAIIILL